LAFESDLGSTQPYGFGFNGSKYISNFILNIYFCIYKNCTIISIKEIKKLKNLNNNKNKSLIQYKSILNGIKIKN
jgi:hypothetical protein